MSWNEPGRGNRDPWGGGGSGNQGPPDLDEVIKKVRGKLGGLFGGKGSSGGGNGGFGGENGNGSDQGGGGAGISGTGIAIIIGVAFLVWMASGIYIVDEGHRGLELRFGQYQQTTTPGPHWRPPYPIGSVEKVNVEERRVAPVGYELMGGDRRRKIEREALMLTRDENIVEVQLAVQYQVGDPRLYRFNFRDPDESLKQVAESSVREVVGRSNLEFVLTEGRAEVAEEVFELVSAAMDNYGTGLTVVSVDMQDIQAPDEVQEAFEDVIMAREDAQRVINQANAYANQVVPEARGRSARIREDAEGYRARVTNEADGESTRFVALLREYERAPEVTRGRIYLDTMAEILERNRKVLIDSDAGDPLLYLPMDQLQRGRQTDGGSVRPLDRDVLERRVPAAGATSSDARSRGDLRSRGAN
ncbi:membrane protease subunit HflK [Natronocella acetinitrilica]|uniref:Protein HflK n=1 Tax=Natronocella acetinitrilica TaxID=414046 RepID=A0AAE3G4P2_9GAMM|nr:FtsH protease activity modulator HflK [Natronocella acetinitrilica]MCP1675014.1 membrane protease subunit HflK [Natronocella acetinitrilica]